MEDLHELKEDLATLLAEKISSDLGIAHFIIDNDGWTGSDVIKAAIRLHDESVVSASQRDSAIQVVCQYITIHDIPEVIAGMDYDEMVTFIKGVR